MRHPCLEGRHKYTIEPGKFSGKDYWRTRCVECGLTSMWRKGKASEQKVPEVEARAVVP